jgi:type IV pilus assembly protein PilO
MPDLRKTRKDLKIALAVMLVVDLLAAVLFFSPFIGSAESRRNQINQLQSELTLKTRQVAPLKDLPEKVKLARQEIGDFYSRRFPSQNSEIAVQVGKIATSTGVRIDQERYKPGDSVTVGLQPIEIVYDLSGNYTSLARFINALERDEMFFIINSVSFGGDPQGPVKLTVNLETYLKAGAA